MSVRTAPALVLFDIDGTLIRRSGPHHKLALIDAVKNITGLTTSFERIVTTGMLDRELIRLMMLEANAPEDLIRKTMKAIVLEAQKLYVRDASDLRRKVCPGVRLALAKLHRSGIPLGLVTGNLGEIGWLKMRRSGLDRYFRFGAFAEQAHTRAELVTIAMRRARRAGWLRRETTVSLVGDHPNDVEAAKLNGIRSIAVGTGLAGKSALVAAKPDVLLPDLRAAKVEMFL